jgi:hypothetical protein
MPTEITKIRLASAAKFGTILGAVPALVIALPAILFGGAITALAGGSEAGLGFISGVLFYLMFVVVAAVGGAILFAIDAFVYNLVASVSGGITVETN